MWLKELVEIAEHYRPNINWGIDPDKKNRFRFWFYRYAKMCNIL